MGGPPTRSILMLALALGAGSASAATSDWDTSLPRGQTRLIEFETDEGTWMSVAPSPNGDWVVFDLLAHVYRVPMSGGEAECLTQDTGVAVNYHPRYSPDGSLVAFISDRGGQDNLWVMNADGSEPRLVWREMDARHSQPVWMPGGESLIVRRKQFKSRPHWERENGLWQVSLDGGESVQLVDDEVPGASWPSISADGRFLYFHVFLGEDLPAGHASTLDGYWQLRRLELASGQTVILTPGVADQQSRSSSGGAFAPEISPDGRWLAFGRQIPDGTLRYREHEFGPRTALWLRDLETGSERLLMDPVEKDVTEGEGALRVLPGYGWTGDGRAIVTSQGGRIRRVDLETGRVTTIPFMAKVKREISEMAKARLESSDGEFTVRFVRWPTLSSRQTQLAFEALGKVWIRTALSGEVRRLTTDDFGEVFESAPSWSPEGRWIVFVTTEGRGGGHVWKFDTTGLTAPVRLTSSPGDYVNPVWSPDGRSVVVARGTGATARDRGMIYNGWFDLVRILASGGEQSLLATLSGSEWDLWDAERRQMPRVSFDNRGRVFFLERALVEEEDNEVLVSHLVSVDGEGSDRQIHLRFRDADEAVVSPDGRRVLYQEGDNIYLTALPGGSVDEPPTVDRRQAEWPVEVLTSAGGLFPRWVDSETVEYGMGRMHFLHSTERGREASVELVVRGERPDPERRVAIANARIITLGAQGVIEKGSILVQGRRILCVGECGVQGADWVIDATGRTVMPGLIDAHVHNNWLHRGVLPPTNMEAASYLAMGVTTVMDPSAWSQNVFPAAELIEAGEMLGPRTFSTGDPLFRGDGDRHNRIESPEDAATEIDRLVAWGATAIKQYNQPRREQRQWIAEAARARSLMLTGEGGDLAFTLGLIMDGQTGWEHPLPYAPTYSDVARFFGSAGATYSATLGVGGPGPWNEEFFLGNWPPSGSSRLRGLIPWRQLGPASRRVIDRPDSDYSFPLIAESIKDILEAGGNSALGSHGQQHGIAPHWEIWMLAEALGPVGALEVATMGGARFLGVDQDLGSLEKGKLADLIVLASNPLQDIRDTADIDLVMKAGTVWHARDLVEAWPTPGVPSQFILEDDVLGQGSRSVDQWDKQEGPP